MVFLSSKIEALPQVEQASVPPWIIGLADDIVAYSVRMEFIEKIFREILVPAFVDMNHDLRTWIISAACVHSIDSGLYQCCKIVPIVGKFSIWPQHAIADFITNLHHVG